jgi:hypothetical protein
LSMPSSVSREQEDTVTEAEWYDCYDLGARVRFLYQTGRASDRKLRLLGAAYARESAALRDDPAGLRRLGVIERYADFHATYAELAEVRGEAEDEAGRWSEVGLGSPPPGTPEWDEKEARAAAHRAVALLATVLLRDEPLPALVTDALWMLGEVGVPALDDLFGNPFRPVSFDPSWRTEAVVALARGVYEERAFGRLPVLADALEDAGCADEAVLAHCRGSGLHVRGCWLVDGLLGYA